MDVLSRMAATGVVPVVVLDKAEDAVPTAKAMLAGGIDAMEITFRTAAAPDSVRAVAQEVTDIITQAAGTDLDIIWGVAINEKLGDAIIVTVIATGFESPSDRSVRHDEILVENKEVNVTKEPEKVDDFAKTFRFRD